MLYLAGHISKQNDLSLMTRDWGAWTGTTYFGIDGGVSDFLQGFGEGEERAGAESFGLFGLMVDQLVPLNIAEIPSRLIVEFRSKRRDEIARFRTCIEELRKSLTAVDAIEIQVEEINKKARELSEAQEQYKASADILKAKGWGGVSLMGFPAPALFNQLLQIPAASSVVLGATGLAIGALYNISKTKEDVRKLKQQSPASYLVDLEQSFKGYTRVRGGGDMNWHAFNCMEEYVND
jgi:hypothetical protein